MIIKIIRGDHFQGLIDYITRSGQYADGEDEARILRLEGIKSIKTATAQLLKSASKAPLRTRRAIHILCRAERDLTDAELMETFKRSLDVLGLTGRQYVAVVHDDGHGHLGACELDRDGKPPPRRLYSTSMKRDVSAQEAIRLDRGDVVSRSWDSHACWRLSKVARELELEFGLRPLQTGVTTDIEPDAGERIKVPDWQLKREGEAGLMPLAHEFGAEIKEALHFESWEERVAALEVYGLGLRAYEGPNSRREGIQIYALSDPTHFCNGSSLGKNYGLGALNKRSPNSLKDWLAECVTRAPSSKQAHISSQSSKANPERTRLRLGYERYRSEHAHRRSEWTELRRDKRRRHRERRDAIKLLRARLLGRGLPKRVAGVICAATRKAMKNDADARHLQKRAELVAYPARRLTWTEWLQELAKDDPAALAVYKDTHRRITKADQREAVEEAARAKEARREEAARAALEAEEKAGRAAAATAKAARVTAAADLNGVARHVQGGKLTPDRPSDVKPAPPAKEHAARKPVAATSVERSGTTIGEKQGSSLTPVKVPPPADLGGESPPRPQPSGPTAEAIRAAEDEAWRNKRRNVGQLLDDAESKRWRIVKTGDDRLAIHPDHLAGATGIVEWLAHPAFKSATDERLRRIFESQENEVADLIKVLSTSATIRVEAGRIALTSVPVASRPMLEPRAAWPVLTEVAKKRVEELDTLSLSEIALRALRAGHRISEADGKCTVSGVELAAAEHALLSDPTKAAFIQSALTRMRAQQATTIADLEKAIEQQPLAPVDEKGLFAPARLTDGLAAAVATLLIQVPELQVAAFKKLKQERVRVETLLETVRLGCPVAEIEDESIVSVAGFTDEQIALLNSPPHRAHAVERVREALSRRVRAEEEAAALVSRELSSAQPPEEQHGPVNPPVPTKAMWEDAIHWIGELGYAVTYDEETKTHAVPQMRPEDAAILHHPHYERATQARLATLWREKDDVARQYDIDEAKRLIAAAREGDIVFREEGIEFSGFADEAKALLEKHRYDPELQDTLALFRERVELAQVERQRAFRTDSRGR